VRSIAAFLVLAIPALAGCGASSGFDRGPIRERPQGERPLFTDAEIQKALEARPQARFPMRVAVFLGSAAWEGPGAAAEDPGPGRYSTVRARSAASFRWTVGDEAAVARWAEPLRAEGIASDVIVVPESLKTGSDLRDARLAAARCGADAVLVLEGAARVDARANALALLNLLILPGWFVPASHRDATVVLRGVLHDVANEFVYLAADAEGEGKIVRPTFRVRDEEAVGMARGKALEDFGREFVRHMEGLKGIAAAAPSGH